MTRFCLEHGVGKMQVYDPSAIPMYRNLFENENRIAYVDHEFEAMQDADVVIISTDWPQFRGLGDMLLAEKARPLIMDGRRMLQHRYTELVAAGFEIIAVGSPFMKA